MMEVGYNSWYSVSTKSPPYQLTSNLKKAQLDQSITRTNRSPLSPGTVRFSSPLSSTYMNGEMNTYSQSSSSNIEIDELSSISPASKLAQMDSSAVKNLTKELHFLMDEIKEKDKELNELVQSHHNQLLSWQADRERMTKAENRLQKLKTEYIKRGDQCKILTDNLKKYDEKYKTKDKEMISLRRQLQELNDRITSDNRHIDELKQKNKTLQLSVEELSSNLGELRALKQQHETLLRLREKNLKDANIKSEELEKKLEKKNTSLNDQRKIENDAKDELTKCRIDNAMLKDEMKEMKTSYHDSLEHAGQEEIGKLKNDVICLQKELMFFGEREQRKDSLLDLAKSKQERTEIELSNLRLLYNSLQSDVISRKKEGWRADDMKFSFISNFEDEDEDSEDVAFNSTCLDTSAPNLLASIEGKAMQECSPIMTNVNSTYLQVSNVQHENRKDLMSSEDLHQVKSTKNLQIDGSDVTTASRLKKIVTLSQKVAEDLERSFAHVSTHLNGNESQNTSVIDGNKTDSLIFGEKEMCHGERKSTSFDR